MESSGDTVGQTATLLSSLCGIINREKGSILGCTWQEYQIRLINLHRGLYGAGSKQLIKEVYDGALQGPPRLFVRYIFNSIKNINIYFLYKHSRSCIRSSLTCLALYLLFPQTYGLWYSQHPKLIYIIFFLYAFYHISPSKHANLGIKFNLGFILKFPCLIKRGWVISRTKTSYLNSSLIVFYLFFFFF